RARRSRAVRSSAATVMAAWRSKPSRCAWERPREVTQGASGSRPIWITRAPARGPSATRPCTAALLMPASAGDSSASGSTPGADGAGETRAAKLVIPREEVAQTVGQRQHPLTHGDMGEHGVHEVGGQFRHAPPATARTEAASLAGKRHETLEGTAFAPDAREASTEHTTCQEISELALDELWQTASIGARGDFGAKRLEVFAHDPMEDGALHGPGLVAGGAHARRPSERHAAQGSRA